MLSNRSLAIFAMFLLAVSNAFTQANTTKPEAAPATTLATAEAAPGDLAKLAITAHGGEKVRAIKTLVMRGSVDLNMFNQIVPASFILITSGQKYYFEINNPFQPWKQIYDGERTYSSLAAQGFSLPPITSLGFPLLPRVGDSGYVVAATGGAKKKGNGFRVTTPEGYYTDFYLDPKTNQIKEYDSSFMLNDQTVATSVAVDEYLVVDGVSVPKKYSQRFDIGQAPVYANFKAKEILVNSEVKDSIFAIK